MEIEEDRRAARAVQELISRLENNEWRRQIIAITCQMVPHLVHHVERFSLALRGNTAITLVIFGCQMLQTAEMEVSAEDSAIIGRVFASLESLKSVILMSLSSRIGLNNLTAAASFVRQTTQIQSLTLHVAQRSSEDLAGHGFHAQRYANLLVHLPGLRSIHLQSLSPEETGIITRAFPSLPNLELIDMAHIGRGSVIFGDLILQPVLRLATLRRLEFTSYAFSENSLHTISEFLSSDLNLSALYFIMCQLSTNGLEPLAGSLKCNETLRLLRFSRCDGLDETFFRTLKDSLQENKTLYHLVVSGRLFTSQSVIDLVAGVRSNYALSAVTFVDESLSSCIDEHQKCFLRCIPRLNQAGRRYLVEDPTSARKGFQVLTEVKDDVDCLFLHLQENPFLCAEVLRRLAIIERGDADRPVIESGDADRSGCFSGAVHLWSHLRSCLSKKKRT